MKSLLRFFLRLLFRFKTFGTEALSTPGPVLLLPNHLSWWDWLFIAVCLEDDWKFATSRTTAQTSWFHRLVMDNRFTFLVENDSPYAVKRMAEFLQKGGRLVLFPEGRLSQTGSLMKLFDGTGFLVHKTHARVITAYLRNAQRLPLSPNPGWKKLFPAVSLHFSPAHSPPPLQKQSASASRVAFTAWIRQSMLELQFQTEMEFGPRNLLEAVIEQAQNIPHFPVLEDLSRKSITYRRLLAGTDAIASRLARELKDPKSPVGLLLPNVSATPFTLLSLWCLGRIPAVLNYSTGPATMLACVQLAGIRQIISSKIFLEKARINIDTLRDAGIQFIFLEELRAGLTSLDKATSFLRASLAPHRLFRSRDLPDSAVILFTSGSEGVPKGVELTHQNILANIRQMLAVTDIQDTDRLFNALPLFHSFGLTVGTFFGLVRGLHVFIYPSPLHYRVVPTVFYDTNSTIFLSTNTFLGGYARKAHPYDFRTLRYLFAAAEKLQEATARTWSQRFGVRILEGYGATECAPCVSVNTPLSPREGSVGRLLPGMEMRIEPVEGVAEGGRLFVRGPNVMKGYLNPQANGEFHALGGWYDTGDIVRVDDDGYLFIQGRLKRFAKISGEMVSLTAVEDALAGGFPHYGLRCQIAVITRPDPDKGEALIAVTNEPKLQLSEIREVIKKRGLSNLCVPREIKIVREIPKLGTGKINHRELQKILHHE